MNLEEFLSERSDLKKTFQHDEKTSVEYYLECNSKSKENIKFHLHSDDNECLIANDSEFRIISAEVSCSEFKKGVIRNNRFVIPQNTYLLIYPFFDCIQFIEKFNIFICSKLKNANPKLIDFYYFDIKGRFIFEEISEGLYFKSGLPSIGYCTEKDAIIEIKKLPDDFNFVEAIDVCTYVVEDKNRNQGVITNEKNWLIKPNYEEILFSKINNSFICYNENEISSFDRNTNCFIGNIKNYQITAKSQTQLKIFDENSNKYGIINFNNEILCEPIYDFVEFSPFINRHVVFNGIYEFKNVDMKAYDFEDFNWESLAKLKIGKWGVVNNKNEIIIPAEFDYIVEVSHNYYAVNKFGDYFKAYYDNHNDEFAEEKLVKGGQWFLYDRDGNYMKETNKKEIEDIINNNKAFYKINENKISIY